MEMSKQAPNVRRVLLVLLCSNAAALILVGIPLFADLPDIAAGYYSGDDLLRLAEPLVTLPLQLALLAESRILVDFPSQRSLAVVLVFAFGAALYQQGAGSISYLTTSMYTIFTRISRLSFNGDNREKASQD